MMHSSVFDYTPWKIQTIFERKARKFYTCEACGRDIIPGDRYIEYKPLPIRLKNGKFKAQKWRKRCIDHSPVYYEEAELYQEGHQIIMGVNYLCGRN